MSWMRHLFGRREPDPEPNARDDTASPHVSTIQGDDDVSSSACDTYVCGVCGETLTGEDLAHAKEREANARYFYADTHKPGMPSRIVRVMDARDRTFYCRMCLDTPAKWQGKDKPCMNCGSFLCNIVRMSGIPDLYCTANGDAAISDPFSDSCPSWQLGNVFGDTSRPAPATPEPASSPRCAECSEEIGDFHYSFEHIVFAGTLGYQCSSCGEVLCAEHAVPESAGECRACGGELVRMEEGPAASSMVDGAKRDGKYSVHIRPPGSTRQVENG